MTFRTVLKIAKTPKTIDYTSKIALLGSCFSDNIAKKLDYHKFDILTNPHGIIFSPKAIEKSLFDIANKAIYKTHDLVQENKIWHSMHHHAAYSGLVKKEVLESINNSILTANTFLKQADHVIITLGTAWVYHYIPQDEWVANCHKIPQNNFIKKLLSIEEVTTSLENSMRLLKRLNPNVNIIFTLSPVRHLKDGFTENAQSKAHLLSAIQQVTKKENSYYFPSYEIMLDDLRDYRFYKEDMLHPNAVAIAYIWDKFKNTWLDEKTLIISEKVAQVQRDLAHKPFNPTHEAHQKFLIKLKQKKAELESLGIQW
jgi:hypothetical protein